MSGASGTACERACTGASWAEGVMVCECIIHVLATGFIRAQEAEGGRVTRAEQLGFCRIASEVERAPVAGEEVLEMRFTLGALQAAT
eukprot:1112114-Pleurochrysis_carterae.AAC.1